MQTACNTLRQSSAVKLVFYVHVYDRVNDRTGSSVSPRTGLLLFGVWFRFIFFDSFLMVQLNCINKKACLANYNHETWTI